MQTILEAQDVTWHQRRGQGEVLESSILGAISGLAVLPEIGDIDDHDAPRGFDDTIDDNNSGRTSRREHLLPAGHPGGTTSGGDLLLRLPKPQKIEASGGRAVLATRAVNGVAGSTSGLGMLECGFGLDTTAEGSVGLPEGSTLFAQRVILRGPVRDNNGQNGCSVTGGDGAGRRCQDEEVTCGSTAQQEGHVLLLSDRVRSKTNVLVSSDGEVAPAVTGTSKVRRLCGVQAGILRNTAAISNKPDASTQPYSARRTSKANQTRRVHFFFSALNTQDASAVVPRSMARSNPKPKTNALPQD